jgi:hypothetical protein
MKRRRKTPPGALRSGAGKGPLRKVVGHKMVAVGSQGTEVLHEELECGHTQPIKQDAFGPTNAVRRRCSRCRKEQETEEDDAQ